MARARREHDWHRTAALMAHLANLRFPKATHAPEDFLPADLRTTAPDANRTTPKRDLRTLMD